MKRIACKNIVQFPTQLSPFNYVSEPHVIETGVKGKYAMFLGLPQKDGYRFCVNHGKLDEFNVLCLQLIYSYGISNVRQAERVKQVQRIIAYRPSLKLLELAAILHCTPEWLAKMMGFEAIYPFTSLSFANAYHLARVGEARDRFLQAATTMSPQEFIPHVMYYIKEQKRATNIDRRDRRVKPVSASRNASTTRGKHRVERSVNAGLCK